MTRGKDFSDTEKAKIEAFREAGKGYGYIAKKLNKSKSAISSFVLKRMGKAQKKRTGRKRKISKRDERQIARSASNEIKTLNDVKKECQLDVHRSTISRAIKRIPHIVRQKMISAPKLKTIHKMARTAFARLCMALNWLYVSFLC